MQSRTPTQVASHAQKYFIRQNNLNKRKRRSSLFDIVSEAPAEPVKAPEVASKVPAGMPGGLSMAFAAGMPGFPGFNPATMPMPPGFGAPNAGAKKGLDEGEKAASAFAKLSKPKSSVARDRAGTDTPTSPVPMSDSPQ